MYVIFPRVPTTLGIRPKESLKNSAPSVVTEKSNCHCDNGELRQFSDNVLLPRGPEGFIDRTHFDGRTRLSLDIIRYAFGQSIGSYTIVIYSNNRGAAVVLRDEEGLDLLLEMCEFVPSVRWFIGGHGSKSVVVFHRGKSRNVRRLVRLVVLC